MVKRIESPTKKQLAARKKRARQLENHRQAMAPIRDRVAERIENSDGNVDSSWQKGAALPCRENPDVEFFIEDRSEDVQNAIALCQTCDYQIECLSDQFIWEYTSGCSTRDMRFGVYGGFSPVRRQATVRSIRPSWARQYHFTKEAEHDQNTEGSK